MLFGWRLWRVCIAISYAIISASFVTWLAEARQMDPQPFIAIVAGLMAAFVSFYYARHALPLLGGLLGVGLIYKLCGGFGVRGMPQMILSGSGILLGAGMAMINRRYLVICITAFLGAVVLMSGMAALLMTSTRLFTTVHTMAMESGIVIPFVLLVPTVMSFFYQISEIRRMQAEL
jgi:hypothetical protein